MTNLDSELKSRDINLPTKVRLVKAMVFPVVMYRCESWTTKKVEHWRTDAFKLWCQRRLLRVPWIAKRSNQSILKEISPEYSLEWLQLKLQYFSHLIEQPTYWRRPWCWERLMARGEGATEDKRVGWHHRLNGHEFEQVLGLGDGQGSLVCGSPGGCKELDMTEWLNWTEWLRDLIYVKYYLLYDVCKVLHLYYLFTECLP